MHTLDSRSLRLGDCFGQKFPVPADIRYFVSAAELLPRAENRTEGGHIIKVLPAVEGSEPQQHNVVVARNQGQLTVEPSRLEIHAGDGVLWHTTDPEVAGFHVAGSGEDFQFNSARIRGEAVFTHAFGVPGRYEWIDPNGSGVGGTIEVEAMTCKGSEERDRWFEMLKKPAGIKIKGKKSSPAAVSITVGQTVFWSITDSPGVAILDKRLHRTSK